MGSSYPLSFATVVVKGARLELLPELGTDKDFNADEPDVETQNNIILTASVDSVRSKFLDCVAELLSLSKGLDFVVSAGLREPVEYTELDVARNGGFTQTVESKTGELLVQEGNVWYISQLQKYLTTDEGIFSTALSGFDLVVINFQRNRVDYWITVAREYIAALLSSQDYEEYHSAEYRQAAENWIDFVELNKSHAEVQLLLHYKNNNILTPSIDYFGCNKKSFLLYEALLQTLPRPISTRGRYAPRECHRQSNQDAPNGSS
ncbi:hypothetical protein B0O99DRAFT_599796 [Bisporella sp. PMI_857]|nr:hypothetical protein B0O99DRAFT_599796 [Bisporella sp. PMI_857]